MSTSFPLTLSAPFTQTYRRQISKRRPLSVSCVTDKPQLGAEIFVESLERHGIDTVFAYPGGASMQIHQAINGSKIKNILPRHEQGGVFAVEGYARVTFKNIRSCYGETRCLYIFKGNTSVSLRCKYSSLLVPK
ncbi:unnamed protein product [Arabis nemorensis]|uniref:Thiamine pyrophosphate enzyme N-terminal TPP-binding domain-containing protein n=1 Tax=Arabis nemorensis TaxID=586526 RepID=A0A565BW26_9BRAS|nr:unnamed protein product [Arabis nemorensis]